MADTFTFSNFAVSTLLYELQDNQGAMNLIVDDAWRFPTNLGGAKVPCVISDDSREPEIVYITTWDPSTGVASIERGREGTTSKNWLAGTLVRHTLTSESFRAVSRVTPRGQWQDDLQYVQGDVVLNNGISYIATSANINSEPTGTGTADWQAIYIPPGGVSETMSWRGLWNNADTFPIGAMVSWQGQIWISLSENFNIEPAYGVPQWGLVAPWGGTHRYAPVLAASGVNNYIVSPSPDVDVPALYDGMRVRVIIGNKNTGGCTLQFGVQPAFPLRVRRGETAVADDFWGGEIYDVTYFEGTTEWVTTMTPEQKRRLDKLETDTTLFTNQVKAAIGYVPKTEWPYDPALDNPDWPGTEAIGDLATRVRWLEIYWKKTGNTGWPASNPGGKQTIQALIEDLQSQITQVKATNSAWATTQVTYIQWKSTGLKGISMGQAEDWHPSYVKGLRLESGGSGVTGVYTSELYYVRQYTGSGNNVSQSFLCGY